MPLGLVGPPERHYLSSETEHRASRLMHFFLLLRSRAIVKARYRCRGAPIDYPCVPTLLFRECSAKTRYLEKQGVPELKSPWERRLCE